MNRWVLLVSALFAAVVVAVDDSSTTTTVPNAEEALATIGSFLKTTEAPQQIETEADNEIANWVVPEALERAYPYYLSGYDEEDRPIWITEFGKFKISHFIAQGPEKVAEFEKYVKKAKRRVLGSVTSKNPQGKTLIGIIDFEGLSFSVFSQIPTLRLLIKIAREYREVLEDHVHYAFVINASYPAERLINLVRPLLGRLLENVEVHGENKNKWQPALLRYVPKDQLPEWYGGVKDHIPLKVYG